MNTQLAAHRSRLPGLLAQAALLCVLAFAGIAKASPAIEITQLPPYGIDGFLQGIVSGVDTNAHEVATFIQIEGSGWWTKPTFGNPTVPIAADGSFSADVVIGGLDNRAVIYCVYLVTSGTAVPLATGDSRVPAAMDDLSVADTCMERYSRTIDFAGLEWGVKESPMAVGPGGNFFSDRNEDVYVDDDGRLHMTLTRRSGIWWATEIILTESFGYGTYSFETESDVDGLDANVVFGAFTWDAYGDGEGLVSPHREIDSEDTRWGMPSLDTGSQWAIAPYWQEGAVHRYSASNPGTPPRLTRFISWSPGQIVFSALSGRHTPCIQDPADLIDSYIYPSGGLPFVPDQGRERFRFNLWLNNNGGPIDGQDVEIIVSDFAFYPLGDSDCDSIVQTTDNCTDVANPGQRDTDTDGFGNRCDADLNNDCMVNFADLDIFRSVFFTADANADLDGNGNVDFNDLSIVRAGFFASPGPAAQASCP